MKDIRSIKTELRNQSKDIRRKMNRNKKLAMDYEIQSKFLSLSEYERSDIIFTYLSKDIEVDTFNIVKSAHLCNKKIAVPRCITETIDMEFYLIESMDDLAPGAFNVLEPIPSRCELVKNPSGGICIVPGLCFDSQGFRLGYGKGYYDRFLSKFKGITVGLCYSYCMHLKLPHGKHDRPVNLLITDKYILKNTRKRSFSKGVNPLNEKK